ncbi:MAG: sigma-70 family RNA polymerase sigma factor [Myxococcales bacterium]|nr:sigma-70 family RNA polymerase sigma factor [Myxococcales bacterium]
MSSLLRDRLGVQLSLSRTLVERGPRDGERRMDGREETTDETLVQRTLLGDRSAFGTLVRRYQERVMALIYRRTGNQDTAADVTQRAFLQAFERLASLRDASAFRPWLFQIAANIGSQEMRSRGPSHAEPAEAHLLRADENPERDMEGAQKRALLRDMVERLPEKQRQCITLRIDAELSFKEIGELVGCSEASARVNFHHGLQQLKADLSGFPGESDAT